MKFSLGDMRGRRLCAPKAAAGADREVQELCPGGGWPDGRGAPGCWGGALIPRCPLSPVSGVVT